MKNNENIEINLTNIQLFTLVFSSLSVIVSMFLTYNQKRIYQGKNRLFKTEDAHNISLYNRILIFVTAIVFLYVNSTQYKLDKNKNNFKGLKIDQLQIYASIITIIAALITIYVAYVSINDGLTEIENPIT